MDEEKVIRVQDVLLIESQFKRAGSVILDGKEQNEFDIDVDPVLELENGKIVTRLRLDVLSKYENTTQVEFHGIMAGTFVCKDLNRDEMDLFSRVNAPAIIFPFMREHFQSTTQKAGLTFGMLGPVNFVKLAEGKGAKSQKRSRSKSTPT